MGAKLFQNLSVNTSQLLVNQCCGLIIFYLLSTQLSKDSFGELNFVLAILLMAFNLLSLGIDQVVVRKVAMGQDIAQLLSLYLYHVFITGVLAYTVLAACSIFISLKSDLSILLLVLGAGKLMIYCSTPFKQIMNGLEKFRVLAAMLVISNISRSAGLVVLTMLHRISLHETILIFALGDLLELIGCIYLFRSNSKIPMVITWHKAGYFQLLKEALPQTGVVLITSAMSRFDWILIGLLTSSVKLAEYSFAYKVFEISTLPLLAIAPLLLPWFARIFKNDQVDRSLFRFLMRAELLVAVFTGLILNILWAPVIDAITAGKYGSINIHTIFFLSLCIPFLYLNNFLWTISFVEGRMRMILAGFTITLLVNVALDTVLIPFFHNEGAAIAFLVASIVQSIYFLYKSERRELRNIWQNLLVCTGCTLISGIAATTCFSSYYMILPVALIINTGLLLITRQIRKKDRLMMAHIFSR